MKTIIIIAIIFLAIFILANILAPIFEKKIRETEERISLSNSGQSQIDDQLKKDLEEGIKNNGKILEEMNSNNMLDAIDKGRKNKQNTLSNFRNVTDIIDEEWGSLSPFFEKTGKLLY